MTYDRTYKPTPPNLFEGKQIIIDSDRIVVNSREESIFLFSNLAIGFSTNGSFHFDSSNGEENNFIVNCPNIYLGLSEDKINGKINLPTEPAVLGEELGKLLFDIFDTIEDITNTLTFGMSYVSPGGNTSVATDPTVFNSIKLQLKSYKKRLGKDFSNYEKTKKSILSKNVKLV